MKTPQNPSIISGLNSLSDFKVFLSKKNYSAKVVLVDKNTRKFCLPIINEIINDHSTITIESGEENKTINTCIEVWEQLADKDVDRKALLINLGGGVICDMGGFIAATFKRGIDFVHIPTTLLSMCDASIGGKLGVNLSGYKNTIGLFKNPKAIVLHNGFLKTLPDRQFSSGFAEIIKHALIGDSRLFNELTKLNNLREDAENLIARSVKIKTKITNFDTFEQGIRKSLNFGHTLGHAFETFFLINSPNNPVLHGEAVAAGMIAESWISYQKKMINENELKQISSFIMKYFSKLKFNQNDFAEIIAYTLKDKKNENQQRSFALLDGIGKFRINEVINEKEIEHALNYYLSI
jgi:3-dehydroquinate synthase